MAILGNTTINGSLNINGVPVEPGSGSGSAGTLNTDNSDSLSVTTESLGGTVNLHKISKTGKYTDLIGSAEAIVATTQNVSISVIDANSFSLSEGGIANILINEDAGSPKEAYRLGVQYLLLNQTAPSQNGLYARTGSLVTDYVFTRVVNQNMVTIGYGKNKSKTFSQNYSGAWSLTTFPEILQATCDTATGTLRKVATASRRPLPGEQVAVTFNLGTTVGAPTLVVGPYTFKAITAFSSLPAASSATIGDVYTVSNLFTTTSDFIDSGASYPAASNVVCVNTGTESSPVLKWDNLEGEKQGDVWIRDYGTRPIRLGITAASTTTFYMAAPGAGVNPPVAILYYDGLNYQLSGSYRTSDSDSYDRMYHNVAKQMGEALYRYKLILEGIDGKFYPIVTTNQTSATLVQKAPTNATLKIGGNILFYNTTTTVAVDGVVSNTYSEISTANMVYSFNQNGGYQLQRPIYLVGIPQAGGGYKLDSNYYTQDLPTTEDGKIYIQLGGVYAQNSLRLEVENPIYEFKDGKVRPYIAEHTHDIATKTEAEDGTDNIKYMTPLRTKQAIDKNLSLDVTIGGNLYVSGVTYFNDEVYFSTIVENSSGEAAVFSPAINTIIQLTQAQYNALVHKNGAALYIIVG